MNHPNSNLLFAQDVFPIIEQDELIIGRLHFGQWRPIDNHVGDFALKQSGETFESSPHSSDQPRPP